MKKWLFRYLIFNLLAFALPSSFTISILEVGNLLSHFHDHEGQNHEHSFLKFIASHYFNKQHHESSHEDHEKLPFHNHDSDSLTISLQSPSLMPQEAYCMAIGRTGVSSSIETITSQRITSSFLCDIWQPPKV